jgi:hypothetical protein
MPQRTPVDLDKVVNAFRSKRPYKSHLTQTGDIIPSLREALKEAVEADGLTEYAGMRLSEEILRNSQHVNLKGQPLLGYEQRDLENAYDQLSKAREALGDAVYKLAKVLTGEQ